MNIKYDNKKHANKTKEDRMEKSNTIRPDRLLRNHVNGFRIHILFLFFILLLEPTTGAFSQTLIPESSSRLVVKIPWKTDSYKLPLHGSGKIFYGPNKLLVRPVGEFCVVFSAGIYFFDSTGKFIKEINENEIGGSISPYNVENYFNGNIGLLSKYHKRSGDKGVWSLIINSSNKITNKKRIEIPEGGSEFNVGLSTGSIYHHSDRTKENQKIDSLLSNDKVEIEKKYFETNYDLPEFASMKKHSEIKKNISDITNKKVWGTVLLTLGKGYGNLYGFLYGVKEGRTGHYGIYVQNIQTSKWQFFLFPPEKDYYASAYILPAIDAKGDVYYLFDTIEGMEIYHLPIYW